MRKSKSSITTIHKPLQVRFKKDIVLNWRLYILLLPGFISLVLFKLLPVGGMVIAFQNYSAFLGIGGSEWVGLENFRRMFSDPYMITLIKNTVILAVLSVICVFPFPVIFSILLNEVRFSKVKSTVQSTSFLPYFISSAVMVSIMYTLLSPTSGIFVAALSVSDIPLSRFYKKM